MVHIEAMRQKGRMTKGCELNTDTKSEQHSDKEASMSLATRELPRDRHATSHRNDVTSNSLAVCLNTGTFFMLGARRITLKSAPVS
jgi:hypothetical protein